MAMTRPLASNIRPEMRLISRALFLLAISMNCCIAAAQVIPAPADFPGASDCEATRSLPSSTPLQPLGEGSRAFEVKSTSNLSACYGVYYGRHDILETCSRYPIDFNLPCVGSSPNENQSFPPIEFAIERADEVAVRLLVDHGAKVTERHLVHLLVYRCTEHEKLPACRSILALLVQHGADINDPRPFAGYNGRDTPLTLAWRQGWFAMAYALIDLHADLNATNTDGCTVLDLAEESNDQDRTNYLRTQGARNGLTCAARKGIKKAFGTTLCLLFACRAH